MTEWTEGEVTILLKDCPPSTVPAAILGPFAVHYTAFDAARGKKMVGYSITHVPTGLSLAGACGVYDEEENAKTAAEIILPLRPEWGSLTPAEAKNSGIGMKIIRTLETRGLRGTPLPEMPRDSKT